MGVTWERDGGCWSGACGAWLPRWHRLWDLSAAWPQDVRFLVWPWHRPVDVRRDLPAWEEASLPCTEPERDGQGLGLSTALVWLSL